MITQETRGYMGIINSMIPFNAKTIIHLLAKYGYEAYLVGGCVRDIIIGREPHDWDICTNAKPENVISLFNKIKTIHDELNIKIIPTGIQHGTVTIMMNGEGYEITTYRCDGKYSDHRRPDTIEFTNTLEEDLLRRDFTVNAIAYSPYTGFIDSYGGINDIKNKIIRCVGNPYDRFNEDGLRIMRAVRFSAQLKFTIDKETEEAMVKLVDNLDYISAERINSELCKILMSDVPQQIMKYEYREILFKIIPEYRQSLGFFQNNPYHCFSVFFHMEMALCDAVIIDNNADIIIRLATFLHDIGKPYCYQDGEDGYRHFKGHGKVSADMVDTIMHRLKFDNDTRIKVVELVYYHDATVEVGKKYIRRWLNILGEEQFKRLLVIRRADINAQSIQFQKERFGKLDKIGELLLEVLEENNCIKIKDLAINGRDLIELGIPEGKLIGEILNMLLNAVIDEPQHNTREGLIKLVNLYFASNPSKYNMIKNIVDK